MWYTGSMNADNLVGKPLVVYIDGDRRQIGTITNAKIEDGKLFVAGKIETDDLEDLGLAEGAIFKAVHEDAS